MLLLAALIGEVYLSNYTLEEIYYTIKTDKLYHSFRIVQLTDLHNRTFGKKNENLIRKIEAIDPDLICMTGDMVNRFDKNSVVRVLELVQDLSEDFPVYFSYGNHECSYRDRYGEIRGELEKAGAIVLDNEGTKTDVNGETIAVGGASSYALIEQDKNPEEYEFLKNFEQETAFKLLLCHIPAGMLLWNALPNWDVDLVLSGHEHGGQIRLPGIGGLYSQDEGLFPRYTEGKFEDSGHTLILSKGLGSGKIIPRIGNPPEITVIDVQGME